MNIHKLLSSKERVKILRHALYKDGCITVSKTASDLRLSKALISNFFTLLKKEGILSKKNEITGSLATRSLKILLNLSSVDIKLFDKPFIESAGLYGSFIRGNNAEGSDIDLWILVKGAKEEQLAKLTSELKRRYSNINLLYLTKEKLHALKNKDELFYHSLFFGSITIYGDGLEGV